MKNKIIIIFFLLLTILVSCEDEDYCKDIICSNHSECVLDNENKASCICDTDFVLSEQNLCVCKSGYIEENNICKYNCGDFINSHANDENNGCICNNGYHFEGTSCVIDITCDSLNCKDGTECRLVNNELKCVDLSNICNLDCKENSKCVIIDDVSKCICDSNYIENNNICVFDCSVFLNSHVNDENNGCICNDGYYEKDNLCVIDINCENFNCNSNEHCKIENNNPICICNNGFHKEEELCIVDLNCENFNCDSNEHCKMVENTPICLCNEGYELENETCILISSCENLNCEVNEHCEVQSNIPTCLCNDKYELKNNICTLITECNLECEGDKECKIINNVPTCISIPTSCSKYQTIFDNDLQGTEMLRELHTLIMPKFTQAEIDSCNLNGTNCDCVNFPHDCDNIGYNRAKEHMFGYIDNENNKVLGVYSGNYYDNAEGTMPNQNQFNCEHTWPQSQFGRHEPMRSDLHHLYPTYSRINSSRGHLPFGIVENPTDTYGNCDTSSENYYCSKRGNGIFEPADQHKGNVARAMLYFAVRYGNLGSSEFPKFLDAENQKSLFLEWNLNDPVNQNDIDRNEAIFLLQNDRNPFIDCPILLNRIDGNTDFPVEY